MAKKAKGLYVFQGNVYTVPQLAELAGIKTNAMWSRLHRHKYDVEKAMRMGSSKKTYTYKGEERPLSYWSAKTGISHQALDARIKAGCTDETIFLPVHRERKPRRKSKIATEGEAWAGLDEDQLQTMLEFERIANQGRWE